MSTIVIAIGNGAGNIVDEFRALTNPSDVDFIYCDTDAALLRKHGSETDYHYLLGKDWHTELELLLNCKRDAIVIIACLGGQTGSLFAPLFTERLRTKTDKLISLVSLPFKFEGALRNRRAVASLVSIENNSDVTIIQQNAKLPDDMMQNQMNEPLVRFLDVVNPVFVISGESINCPFVEWANMGKLHEFNDAILNLIDLDCIGVIYKNTDEEV